MAYNKKSKSTKNKYNSRSGKKMLSSKEADGKDLLTDRSGVERSKDNDVAWYTHSKELLNGSASISMNNAAGAGMNLVGGGVDSNTIGTIPPNPAEYNNFDHRLFHVPGICVVRTLPCAGFAKDNTSPVNVAAKNIYTWVRHMNSGAKNYNSPDLMIYIIAMTQAYAFYAWLTRLYGVVNLYSQVNRYLPDALIRAMGADPITLRKQLPQLHYYINAYANKLGSMCIPSNMPLVWRQTWMYSGLYSDGDNQKSQLYLYNPSQFLAYSATADTQGGKLVATLMPRGDQAPFNFTQITSLGDSLLNPILSDEDMNIMSGDIKKAYGESGLMKVSEIERNYTIVPKYSPEVLAQMQNATIVPINNMDIVQDVDQNCLVNAIKWADFSASPKNWVGGGLNHVFNLFGEDSSPERVMVASRLMSTMRETVTFNADHTIKSLAYDLTSCGTEIAVETTIWTIYPETHKTVNLTDRTSFGQMTFLNAIARTKFAYAPIFMIAVQESTPTEDVYYPQGVVGDLDNWTVLDHNDIRKMHETATLSELAVPQMGMAQ
jgi:hypothetical protein